MRYLKYQILLFLLLSPLFSDANKMQAKKQEEIVSSQVAEGKTSSTSSDVMIVDPKEVSKDWKLAFMMLQNKGLANLVFHLEDGSEISQIDSIEALPGGYLMLLTTKSLHGLQYKIVKTSEISSLTAK
jgi:hypothetical protein